MLNTLQISDFKMHSMDQTLNFKLLQDNLEKKDCLKYPILKMKTNIRLKLKRYPILKKQDDIQLKKLRLRTGFRNFFTDPPEMDRCHPP